MVDLGCDVVAVAVEDSDGDADEDGSGVLFPDLVGMEACVFSGSAITGND